MTASSRGDGQPGRADPATVSFDELVARVRGLAASELARRLGPTSLFAPSADDEALAWAVISERLAEAHPRAAARLRDGSRLHVICPPLAPFTCLTVRRHRLLAHSLDDLLALGTLTPEVAGLLGAVVRAGLNLLISGGTGAGKTTT